jgi:hypothetical protein
MLTNNIIRIVTGLLGFVLIPIVPISTFVLGLLVFLTFGLFLLPISLVWSGCFYFPLLGLSFVYENMKILRPIAAIIGIPIAITGEAFVSLMPSMGENDSKMAKWLSTTSFPFTYSISHFNNPNKLRYLMKKEGHYRTLLEILYREKSGNPLMTAYINNNLLNK